MADFWGQFQPVTLQAPPPQPAMDQLSFTQQYRAQHPKATPAQVQAAWQDYARSQASAPVTQVPVPPRLPPVDPNLPVYRGTVPQPDPRNNHDWDYNQPNQNPGTLGNAAVGPQGQTLPGTTQNPATGSPGGQSSTAGVQGGNSGDLGGPSWGVGDQLPVLQGDGSSTVTPGGIVRHTTGGVTGPQYGNTGINGGDPNATVLGPDGRPMQRTGGGTLSEQGPFKTPATGGAAIGAQPGTILPATTQNPSSGGGFSNTAPPPNNTTPPTGGGMSFAQRNDPNFVRQKVTESLTRKYGHAPSEDEIQADMNYVLKPDTYSDGKVHSGWSDYWDDRFGNPAASGGSGADNGGNDTLVGGNNVPGGGGGNGGVAGAGNGNIGPQGPNGTNNLPPGYTIGDLTGGGKYPLSSFNAPGINKPWTTAFNAPDLNDTNDPGYSARMKMGTDAILRNKAAEGTLRTGGALKDLTQFGQDYASNEYDKVYGRALGEYNNAYGIYTNNQNNVYNRLGDYAKMGLTAAGAGDTSGLSSAIGNNANNASDLYTNQANADATKDITSSNSWRDILKGIGKGLGA